MLLAAMGVANSPGFCKTTIPHFKAWSPVPDSMPKGHVITPECTLTRVSLWLPQHSFSKNRSKNVRTSLKVFQPVGFPLPFLATILTRLNQENLLRYRYR